MDVSLILLAVALIIIFGFIAEAIFRKIGIPDILLLVILGFLIGPNVFKFVDPASLVAIAPLFTTFALLFLMFEGSLSIDLGSFARGLFSGSTIAFFNFIISVLAITAAMFYIFSFEFLISLLVGCVLGGISSAFVLPLLKQLKPRGEVYTILTLEAALTDVFTIVFSLTVMQLIKINVISFQAVASQLISLFAIACFIGFLGAGIWIIIDKKILNGNKNYMSTIAFVILLYLVTEYFGGNGAIASMFFGLFITNSKLITSLMRVIKTKDEKERESALKGDFAGSVSDEDQVFFGQISFFLKTFFFVYIGILLNVSNTKAMIIGSILAVIILIVRNLSFLLTRKLAKQEKNLINSIFARGLAAAAVMQILVESRVITDLIIVDITYFFIVSTIVLSSARIFIYKVKYSKTRMQV